MCLVLYMIRVTHVLSEACSSCQLIVELKGAVLLQFAAVKQNSDICKNETCGVYV